MSQTKLALKRNNLFQQSMNRINVKKGLNELKSKHGL
jgi:hypothetical protein